MFQTLAAGATDAAGALRALSTAYLRLEDVPSALDAAARSRRLDPRSAASYRQEAEALVAAGRAADAAVPLMAGVFLTADSGLWEELLRLYRGGLDAEGCATRPGARGPALNPSCAIVRRHFCAAAHESIQAAFQTGRPDLARRIKAAGLQEFGCDAAALN